MRTTIKRRTLLGGVGATGAGAVTLGAIGAPRAATARTPARRLPAEGDFLVGIAGAHYITQNRGYDPESLAMLQQSGANAIRVGMRWSSVEQEKGVYEFDTTRGDKIREAVAAGLDVMVVLTGTNPIYDDNQKPTSEEAVAGYTGYVLTVVENLKDVVTRFEIWNEWESGNGDPKDYLRVLRSASEAVRAAAPGVELLAGGMERQKEGDSEWIDALLEGGVLALCDALSLHTYSQGESVELRTPEAWVPTRMEFMAERVRRYNDGNDFPMYVTEMGWPNDSRPIGTGYDEAAAFLTRLYLLAASLPYCKGMYWYNLQDNGFDAANPQHNFGLIRPDGTPKPAFYAFQSVAGLLGGNVRYVRRLESDDPDIWALKFVRGQESMGTTIALWSGHLANDWSVVLRDGDGRARDQLDCREAGRPAFTKKWGREEWYTSPQMDPDEPVLADEVEFTLRKHPLLISGVGLDDATITRVLERPFPAEEDRPDRPS